MLDKDFHRLQIQNDINGNWECHYYFGLILGFLCLLVSIAWVVHM